MAHVEDAMEVEEVAVEVPITCPGDVVWGPIDQYLSQQGSQTMMEKFQQKDGSYDAWLRDSLGVASDGAWDAIPSGEEKGLGTVPLFACPVDYSRRQALRAVGYRELVEKMKAIVLAQDYRVWDELPISRLPSTTGKEGTFIEDFHIRLCALDALCRVCWLQGLH